VRSAHSKIWNKHHSMRFGVKTADWSIARAKCRWARRSKGITIHPGAAFECGVPSSDNDGRFWTLSRTSILGNGAFRPSHKGEVEAVYTTEGVKV
jgi:hypothetical protein